jgi:hypothetical protein
MQENENLTSAEPVNPALFAFDNPDGVEVKLNLTPDEEDPDKIQIVWHKFRRANAGELDDAVAGESTELRDEGKRAQRIMPSSDAHLVKLWDRTATAVKGYDDPIDEWRTLTDADKTRTRSSHKVLGITGAYTYKIKIERTGRISLGGDEWTVKQEFPSGEIVRYRFREPTENERRNYRNDSRSVMQTKGENTRLQIKHKLKPCVDLFNALLLNVTGGTVQGKSFAEIGRDAFLQNIDPLYKRDAVDTLLPALDGAVQD